MPMRERNVNIRAFCLTISMLLVTVALLAGCAGNNGNQSVNDQDPVNNEQVADKTEQLAATKAPVPTVHMDKAITLNLMTQQPVAFENVFQPILNKKYPNVTFNVIQVNKAFGAVLLDLIATKNVPDFLMFNNGFIDQLLTFKIIDDISPLVKKYDQTFETLYDGVMESIASYSSVGEIVALPVMQNPEVLVYNKQIFDNFGVDYPTDGMSWDQTYELAVKMTRTVGDVSYQGFDYIEYAWFNNQLSLPLLDPETGNSLFNTEGWIKWINNFKRFYEIPGSTFNSKPNADQQFVKDQNIAMTVSQNLMFDASLEESNIDWDMVTLPTFDDRPGMGAQLVFHGIGIPQTSQYKDEVFAIISYMLTDEFQLEVARNGLVPISKSGKVVQQFGVNSDYWKSKNTDALFKLKIAVRPLNQPHQLQARTRIGPAIAEIMMGNKDVVTALREADEAINQAIAAEKAK